MHLFFEDDGDFNAATVLDSVQASAGSPQVELASGKRLKIKLAQVLLRFEQPGPEAMMREAAALAGTLDLDFLWEAAPQDEFEAAALAIEYFGATPTLIEQAALLMRLHGAPVYFRRRGKGRYKPATQDELAAALAALERKRKLGDWQAGAAADLVAGRLPATRPDGSPGDWATRAPFLLHKPEKNGAEAQAEQKAIEQAMHDAQSSAAKLLLRAGAFGSARELHRSKFMVEWFPSLLTGRGAPAPTLGKVALDKLPLATVKAFSIDDSETTEIDDALSVQWTDAGSKAVRIGVHIAAPGLIIHPADALDAWARKRMSTVYMPGEKIKVLPDGVFTRMTLEAGTPRPALSLYADFDVETGECAGLETRIERIEIAENLRHDRIDHLVTEQSLDDDLDPDAAPAYPFQRELRVLWRVAKHLTRGREEVRGKPEPAARSDFTYRLDSPADAGGEPVVRIEQRKRGAPLDRIVAEWMIFANSSWGRRLGDAGVPAIYRVQTAPPRPGMRASSVRMTTNGDKHIGLGVSHYAWSTSPLRRYVDLVNQWQLLAILQLQRPPFERGSAELFAIIGAFEAAYGAYAEIQSTMERYWCLRWLDQQGRIGSHADAVVLRNENIRFAEIPLVTRASGIGHLPIGTRIEVEIIGIDELDLGVQVRLVAVHAEEGASAEVEEEPEEAAELEAVVEAELDAQVGAVAAPDATSASTSSQSGTPDAPQQVNAQ
ncbi:RNB domain-containing ribonuclease [soil metagenome]